MTPQQVSRYRMIFAYGASDLGILVDKVVRAGNAENWPWYIHGYPFAAGDVYCQAIVRYGKPDTEGNDYDD